MPTTVRSMQPREHYLDVQLAGEWDDHDFLEYLPTVKKALQQNELKRVLLDYREVAFKGSTFLEHAYAEYLAGNFQGVRLGFLAPTTLVRHNLHLENAAQNRGVNIRVFWSDDEAAKWISAA